MKPAIYIETTIVSYIAARPSREPFLLGCQRLTRRWWREKRRDYELFSSRAVSDEAQRGDACMAARRVRLLRDVQRLEVTEDAQRLADAFSRAVTLPENAASDAMHVALAAVYGLDYLLTWNCKHIANPAIEKTLHRICEAHGFTLPLLITPVHLLPTP